MQNLCINQFDEIRRLCYNTKHNLISSRVIGETLRSKTLYSNLTFEGATEETMRF